MLLQIVETLGVLSVTASIVMCGFGMFGNLPIQPYGPIALALGLTPLGAALIWLALVTIWGVR